MNFDIRQRHRLTVPQLQEQIAAMEKAERTSLNPNAVRAAQAHRRSLEAWVRYWRWLRIYQLRVAGRVQPGQKGFRKAA